MLRSALRSIQHSYCLGERFRNFGKHRYPDCLTKNNETKALRLSAILYICSKVVF